MIKSDPWHLRWAHGALQVNPLACALEPLEFYLPDGRVVSPFHCAAWVDGQSFTPPLMGGLRGEWPCLPFGYARQPDDLASEWQSAADIANIEWIADQAAFPHGQPANSQWRALASAEPAALGFVFDFPADAPLSHIERWVRVEPERAEIAVSVTIFARRPCRGPFAFHPTFRLPLTPQTVEILPGAFAFGLTHPTIVEPGFACLQPNARFDRLDAVPALGGGVVDCTRLPLPMAVEQILYLAGVQDIRLIDHSQQVIWHLRWDSVLPGCVLWLSNGGRTYAPWGGRNICLGVEPCAAPMDLGTACAVASNPINQHAYATALDFAPTHPTTLGYRLAAQVMGSA